jgi:hypothetical protein
MVGRHGATKTVIVAAIGRPRLFSDSLKSSQLFKKDRRFRLYKKWLVWTIKLKREPPAGAVIGDIWMDFHHEYVDRQIREIYCTILEFGDAEPIEGSVHQGGKIVSAVLLQVQQLQHQQPLSRRSLSLCCMLNKNIQTSCPQARICCFLLMHATHCKAHAAVQHLERGGILVATYGFGVGLNLKVRNKFPSKICALGIPWSAESAVQAAGRMREGGVFRICLQKA